MAYSPYGEHGRGWDLPGSEEPPSLEDLQNSLELGGMFDPTGLLDLINALIYSANGEWGDACLSGISMVPYVGDAVGKGGKLLGKASKSVTKAAAEVSEAALKKGNKFFKGFSKRNPFGQTTKQIGEFTEFGVNVPGRVPGSYTRWVKVVNQDGRTVRLYHDTFDKTGKFINRGVKVPGPERHVP